MPDTAHFGVLGELDVSVLRQKLSAAWDNQQIPHDVTIPAGQGFGPYTLQDGHATIDPATLTLDMDPPVNGVRFKFRSHIGIHVANPPVPSLTSFEMDADMVVSVPLKAHNPPEDPALTWVALFLEDSPRAGTSATLLADPVPAITLDLIREYVKTRYQDGTVQTYFSQEDFTSGAFTGDVEVTLLNDDGKPDFRINVTAPSPGQVMVSLPVHIRISGGVFGGLTLPSPMGALARVEIETALQTPVGHVKADLPSAGVNVVNVVPAPTSEFPGPEGANYSAANSLSGGFLESQLKLILKARAQAAVTAIGVVDIPVPTKAQIETLVADHLHSAIVAKGVLNLWTPQPPPDSPVTITDPKPKALADALAICMNPQSGNDINAVTDLIPAGKSCIIAVSRKTVLDIIESRRDSLEVPDEVDGHKVKLNSLNFDLTDGAIVATGSVTVVDAVLGSIDVDADFEVRIGLEWVDQPDGTQMLTPVVLDTDVSMGLLGWILAFLLGFITGGIIGVVIVGVVYAIVDDIANSVGGKVARDNATNQVTGIGPWPQTVEGVGTVEARFENPVDIDHDGIGFPDAYKIKSVFADTIVATATGGGPYTVLAGSELTFLGGPAKPHTTYGWEFGDGATASVAVAKHTYGDNGTYVAKLRTVVTQPGGADTRDFAKVVAVNVPAIVDAGPDITIDEGEEVEFEATFTDNEWLDTHTARFDFGDDSMTVAGTVQETNNKPQAKGTAKARHAYCDNGDYIVTVRIIDDDGGVGLGVKRVHVLNVPPKVEAGPDLFAYPCTPIRLAAMFTDPGWCDTHTGTWSFGDCTPVQPAIIDEKRQPPATIGYATALHTFHCCGDFFAECIVTDDDGGVGRDNIVVRVVDVLNPGFEDGFWVTTAGEVGNDWRPVGGVHGARDARFSAEEFVVHGGQRSQKASGRGAIFQRIGANPGWEYEATAWFHQPETVKGQVAIGIDPEGGDNPASANIVWSKSSANGPWFQLSVRTTARTKGVTVFLAAESETSYFDDVHLTPYPCPFEFPERRPPDDKPKPKSLCVDWLDEREPRQLGLETSKNGFTFVSARRPLFVASWGPPPNQGKLQFADEGVLIRLPFAADRVTLKLVLGASAVQATAYSSDPPVPGAEIDQKVATPVPGQIVHLELNGADILTVLLRGGKHEGLIVEVCAEERDQEKMGHKPSRPSGRRSQRA